jgi:hypothetical protein
MPGKPGTSFREVGICRNDAHRSGDITQHATVVASLVCRSSGTGRPCSSTGTGAG